MTQISILGCGWLGLPLGVSLHSRGFLVTGSTTRQERLAKLEAAGIRPVLLNFNPALQGMPDRFFDADVLIISIPPRMKNTTTHLFLEQVRAIVAAIKSGSVRKIIFISSTSVYPDTNSFVFEGDADVNSTLYQAEEMLVGEKNFQTTIIRFAGLAGPSRHPGRFLSGKTVGGRENPVNLIHLDDCIEVIIRIIEMEKWSAVFNACADLHPTKFKFYTWASNDLGVLPPVFIEGDSGNFKIISSEKLKRELNFSFKFPDPMQMTFK